METFIADWLADGNNWSERTSQTYGWYVRRFAVWCAGQGVTGPAGITRALLRRWSAVMRERWAPATVKGATAAVRSFCVWLEVGGLADDLHGALRSPAVPRVVQRTISGDEFRRIYAAAGEERRCVDPDVSTWLAARDRAIVCLLYDSMLRASELCGLTVGDVRVADQVIVIKRGKGGNARLAFYSADTAGELVTWLSLRGPVGPGVRLFVTAKGRPLTPRSLRQLVQRIGQRSGVAAVSPHAFRRGGAAAAVLAGCPGRLLQIAGGWSDARMIEIYTRSLESSEATREAWLRFSPVISAR